MPCTCSVLCYQSGLCVLVGVVQQAGPFRPSRQWDCKQTLIDSCLWSFRLDNEHSGRMWQPGRTESRNAGRGRRARFPGEGMF